MKMVPRGGWAPNQPRFSRERRICAAKHDNARSFWWKSGLTLLALGTIFLVRRKVIACAGLFAPSAGSSLEREGADERLLTSLGLRDERKTQKATETTHQGSNDVSPSRPRRKKGKPGDRNPGRDKTGEYMYEGDDTLTSDADEEEAVG